MITFDLVELREVGLVHFFVPEDPVDGEHLHWEAFFFGDNLVEVPHCGSRRVGA